MIGWFPQVWKVKKAFKIQVFWKGSKPTLFVRDPPNDPLSEGFSLYTVVLFVR